VRSGVLFILLFMAGIAQANEPASSSIELCSAEFVQQATAPVLAEKAASGAHFTDARKNTELAKSCENFIEQYEKNFVCTMKINNKVSRDLKAQSFYETCEKVAPLLAKAPKAVVEEDEEPSDLAKNTIVGSLFAKVKNKSEVEAALKSESSFVNGVRGGMNEAMKASSFCVITKEEEENIDLNRAFLLTVVNEEDLGPGLSLIMEFTNESDQTLTVICAGKTKDSLKLDAVKSHLTGVIEFSIEP